MTTAFKTKPNFPIPTAPQKIPFRLSSPWLEFLRAGLNYIITMTTRPPTGEQGMSLRSNRKLPALPPVLPPCTPLPETTPSPDSQPTDNHPPHEPPAPRTQKENVPLPNENRAEGRESERRVTRSRANSIGIGNVAPGACGGVVTAVEVDVGKKEEFSANKQEKQTLSAINLPSLDPTASDPIPPPINPKKSHSRSSPLTDCSPVPSPYSQIRKSYRKFPRGEVLSFPYRKCHDPLEGRITAVLNKLAGEKECRKEMEGLADRLGRTGSKDLRNRFVVAGLKMVVRMARERKRQGGGVQGRLLARLQGEEKAFQARIAEELTDFSEFQDPTPPPTATLDANASSYRARVMKKLYSILKGSGQQSKGEIRRQVVSQCLGFFAGEVSMGEMVRFVRQRLEG